MLAAYATMPTARMASMMSSPSLCTTTTTIVYSAALAPFVGSPTL
jgi:hypothetical protein